MKNYKIKDSDIEILRSARMREEDIKHCVKVAEKALEIARRTDAHLDVELIARAGLFHDLGKAVTHGIEHGKIGAAIGKQLGLPKKITDIMEKHIRGGLSEDEARELNLPVKDYTLRKLEEKIVIYADRLVDIITDGIIDLDGDEHKAEEKFEQILRDYPKYGKNDKTLRRYLGYHREIQSLINRLTLVG